MTRTTYKRGKSGYCYKTVNNKTIRISEAEYKMKSRPVVGGSGLSPNPNYRPPTHHYTNNQRHTIRRINHFNNEYYDFFNSLYGEIDRYTYIKQELQREGTALHNLDVEYIVNNHIRV